MHKYIFVTGGVVSSLGKGLTAASIAHLLEIKGFRVSLIKADPYLNIDPGTMNPFQHGEVYVTEDGSETDLDLGHYERFISHNLSKKNSITAGRVYKNILSKERQGHFLGETVQIIPHVTNEIKRRIRILEDETSIDCIIVEIGGTVGDIEGMPFLESIRQLRKDISAVNPRCIHVTLIPYIKAAEELKTKPTQHSVERLREIGIQPDIIICRTEYPLTQEIKEKISLFCNVDYNCVIEEINVKKSIYELPFLLESENLNEIIVKKLQLESKKKNLKLQKKWQDLYHKILNPVYSCNIGVVGKYINLQDSYKSIYESLHHAGFANKTTVNIIRIDADSKPRDIQKEMSRVDGLLVPGGFGNRGIDGKVNAIQYARTHKIPFFGICLGLQCAMIEYARNVCGLPFANSTEFDKNPPDPIIILIDKIPHITNLGGSMRLGLYPCRLKEKTLSHDIYSQSLISERHRHRYEVNPLYLPIFEKNGLVISGNNPENNLIEIVEIPSHPWFIGVQFHPEFQSKPILPHPLFRSFIEGSLHHKKIGKVKK